MVAGFAIGLVLGAVGLPRRLGKQIFAVSEGFFTPIFFVTLGATLDVRAALSQPRLLELALAIFLTNLIAHLVVHRRGKLIWLTLIAVAQLGVPVAAVTMAFSIGTLSAGEGAAIMLAALLSVLVAIISAAKYRRAISPREKS
jgi:Kef-type K+ transport system membrane component KefB